jgi:hypothetical protein
MILYWTAILLAQSATTIVSYFILFINSKVYLSRSKINWHVIKNIYFTSEASDTIFSFGCLSSLVTYHIWNNWLDNVNILPFFQKQITLPLEMLLAANFESSNTHTTIQVLSLSMQHVDVALCSYSSIITNPLPIYYI